LSRAYIENEAKSRPRVFNVDALEKVPNARVFEVCEATEKDNELQRVITMIRDGWPEIEKN